MTAKVQRPRGRNPMLWPTDTSPDWGGAEHYNALLYIHIHKQVTNFNVYMHMYIYIHKLGAYNSIILHSVLLFPPECFLCVYSYPRIVFETCYMPLRSGTHQEHVPANVITYNSAISALGCLGWKHTWMGCSADEWGCISVQLLWNGENVDKKSEETGDNNSARDRSVVFGSILGCFNDGTTNNLN